MGKSGLLEVKKWNALHPKSLQNWRERQPAQNSGTSQQPVMFFYPFTSEWTGAKMN